jgi:hypothetical protein
MTGRNTWTDSSLLNKQPCWNELNQVGYPPSPTQLYLLHCIEVFGSCVCHTWHLLQYPFVIEITIKQLSNCRADRNCTVMTQYFLFTCTAPATMVDNQADTVQLSRVQLWLNVQDVLNMHWLGGTNGKITSLHVLWLASLHISTAKRYAPDKSVADFQRRAQWSANKAERMETVRERPLNHHVFMHSWIVFW